MLLKITGHTEEEDWEWEGRDEEEEKYEEGRWEIEQKTEEKGANVGNYNTSGRCIVLAGIRALQQSRLPYAEAC